MSCFSNEKTFSGVISHNILFDLVYNVLIILGKFCVHTSTFSELKPFLNIFPYGDLFIFSFIDIHENLKSRKICHSSKNKKSYENP